MADICILIKLKYTETSYREFYYLRPFQTYRIEFQRKFGMYVKLQKNTSEQTKLWIAVTWGGGKKPLVLSLHVQFHSPGVDWSIDHKVA